MKFKIKQKKLKKLLSISNKAINFNIFIIPIFSGIIFDIKKNSITLTSSNNTLNIKVYDDNSNNFEVQKEGIFILPSKYITEIVKKINEEWINFEKIENNYIKITCPSLEIKLKSFDINDYPEINFINKYENLIKLNNIILGNAIKNTIYCTSNNDGRNILNGINFNLNKDKSQLSLIASDSFRIARKNIYINENMKANFNFTLPYKTVNEILKLNSEIEEQEIKLFFNDKKVLFEFDKFLIQSNVIEEKYPNIDKVIPSSYKLKINLDRIDIIETLERALLLSKDLNNNTINMIIEENKLLIMSNSQEVGYLKEVLKIKNINNNFEIFKISVNGRFLLESIKNLKSCRINLLFNDNLSQFEINSDEEIDLKQLIVPLKTHDIN